MLRNDDLFRLIKSLSRAEKRYFSIWAARHVIGGKNKYMLLYETLDAMAEYSEPALKKRMAALGVQEHLSTIKNYLYNLILAGMQSFNSGESIDSRLRNALQAAEFLYNKNLHDQCARLLEKYSKLALAHDRFPALLEFLQKQRELISRHAEVSGNIERLFEEESRIIDLRRNLRDYQHISAQVFRVIRTQSTSKEQPHLDLVRNNPLLASEDRALSNSARLFFYSVHAGLAYLDNRHADIYRYCKSHVQLIEKLLPERICTIEQYANSLHNFVHACLDAHENEEARAGLVKLRALRLPERYQHIQVFVTHASIQSLLFIRSGEPDGVASFLREFEKEHVQYADAINTEQLLVMAVYICHLYFIIRRPDEALRWNNVILDYRRGQLRKDIIKTAEYINLVLLYDLGHLDALASALPVFQRRLSRQNDEDKLQRFLARTLLKLLNAPPDEVRAIACSALHQLAEYPSGNEGNARNIRGEPPNMVERWLRRLCGKEPADARRRLP